MKNARAQGFTLIELLTVVAIIAILASMVFTVAPRMLEKSKIASLMNTCNQIRTACVAFAAKSKTGSFPPMYGYKILGSSPVEYSLAPYMSHLNMFRNMGAYDLFARDTYDTDGDGHLSPLEFCPVGQETGPDVYTWPNELYNEANLAAERDAQLSEKRPLVYIPVNSEQARLVADYYWKVADWYATRWQPAEVMPDGKPNPLTKLKFPPTKYDDFVLISVGPTENTGGILTASASFKTDLDAQPAENRYHILALRAYFLATRDMNNNDILDFDCRNRKRGKEAEESAFTIPGMNALPDGTVGVGPLIYRQASSN